MNSKSQSGQNLPTWPWHHRTMVCLAVKCQLWNSQCYNNTIHAFNTRVLYRFVINRSNIALSKSILNGYSKLDNLFGKRQYVKVSLKYWSSTNRMSNKQNHFQSSHNKFSYKTGNIHNKHTTYTPHAKWHILPL